MQLTQDRCIYCVCAKLEKMTATARGENGHQRKNAQKVRACRQSALLLMAPVTLRLRPVAAMATRRQRAAPLRIRNLAAVARKLRARGGCHRRELRARHGDGRGREAEALIDPLLMPYLVGRRRADDESREAGIAAERLGQMLKARNIA